MDHVEFRELVLTYEDLTDDERRLVDAHLEGCAACRHLLGALQDAEHVAAEETDLPPLLLPDDPDILTGLDESERAAAAMSRRQLMAEVRATSRKQRPWWPAGMGGLALAAALALMVWQPWVATEAVVDLRLAPVAMVRGGDGTGTGGDEQVSARAVTLRYVQQVDGWPVVVRVREGEAAEVLLPTTDWPSMKLEAGRPVVLPPAGSRRVWTTAPAGVKDTYLVVVSQEQEPSVAVVQALVEARGDVEDMRHELSRHFGSRVAVSSR